MFFNDSLPYFDREDDAAKAKALILEEMKNLKPSTQESKLNVLEFKDDPILKSEFKRISRGEPMTLLSTEQYKLKAPETDDIESWRKAVENAKVQLQHQRHRNVNAELLKKYGTLAWKAHSYQLTGLCKMLESRLSEQQEQVENTNKKRKISQVNGGRVLQAEYNRYLELTDQILQLKLALALLKTRLERQ